MVDPSRIAANDVLYFWEWIPRLYTVRGRCVANVILGRNLANVYRAGIRFRIDGSLVG
jgi:hypothetical protein